MKRVFAIILVVGSAAGCAQMPMNGAPGQGGDGAGTGSAGSTRPMARPDAIRKAAKAPPPGARTVAQLDTTTATEKKAAAAAAQAAQASGAGRRLGRTVASLGDPTDPGLWIRTPLVDAPAKGRVVYPANGKAVELDLIPIEGPKTAGSRMSLAALRVIGAPLTDLPEVDVYIE